MLSEDESAKLEGHYLTMAALALAHPKLTVLLREIERELENQADLRAVLQRAKSALERANGPIGSGAVVCKKQQGNDKVTVIKKRC